MSLKDLDEKLSEYCEKEQISGSLRITVKGNVEYSKSFGYAIDEKKTKFTKDSMFTFYSMSKPFCAIGLLKLREQGLIDLDVHPKKYLPEAQGFNEKVTIRHLLHHVSGLPDFEQNADFVAKHPVGRAKDSRSHLRLLVEYPSVFEPNTSAMYANINFIIPALIIENVSGLEYGEYMQKNVFSQIGAKTAKLDHGELVVENRVQGYELKDGKRVPIGMSYNWLIGAGDVVGTVDDAYTLNLAYKNKLLLSEKTWEEIVTPSPINRMGLGNTVYSWHDKLRINHNGGHLGFRTLHIQLPEDDFDVILLSNSGYGTAREDMAEMIYQEFYGDDGLCGEKIQMDKGYI